MPDDKIATESEEEPTDPADLPDVPQDEAEKLVDEPVPDEEGQDE